MDWEKELIDDVAGSLEEYEERPVVIYPVMRHNPVTVLECILFIFIGIPLAILFIVVLAVVSS